ncbi:DUF7512 family protein [Natronosalvus vescus]|nr:hypothetical protein [Natronosalvus vescus]
MIDVITLPLYVQAILLLVLVLVEAVGFYAGYGAIERVIAPPVIETLEQV